MSARRTDRPPAPSPRQARRQAELALCAAALEYAEQSSGGGEDPLFAGARLRLAAKQYALADRACRVLP